MHQDAAAQQKLLSRSSYVFRALFILLAMSISIASLVWCLRYDGSLWWLAAADVPLIAPFALLWTVWRAIKAGPHHR